MDDPEQAVAVAQERMEIYTRIQKMITEADGPRAIETVNTYVERADKNLAAALERSTGRSRDPTARNDILDFGA